MSIMAIGIAIAFIWVLIIILGGIAEVAEQEVKEPKLGHEQ